MMFIVAILLCCSLMNTAMSASLTQSKSCVYTVDEHKFNFASELKYYIANDTMESNKYQYFIDLCGPLQLPEHPQALSDNAAVWQKSLVGESLRVCNLETGCNCGVFDSLKLSLWEGGVQIVFTNGTACRSGVKRTSYINMTCSHDHGFGKPILIAEDKCNYYFKWTSSAACEIKESKLSGAAIFFIILFVAVGIYFIGGISYKRFVCGQKGWEQIPNIDLWRAIGTMGRSFCDCFFKSSRPPAHYSEIGGLMDDDEDSLDAFEDDERLLD